MIIYEDKEMIVINKAPNIASQPGRDIRMSTISLMQDYLSNKRTDDEQQRRNELENKRPDLLGDAEITELLTQEEDFTGTTHRLDKNTTGVMTLAKSKNFARQFGKLLYEQEEI